MGEWVVIYPWEFMGIFVVVPHVTTFIILSTIHNFMTKNITIITIAKEMLLVHDWVIPYWWKTLPDYVLVRNIFLLWSILIFLPIVFNLDRILDYIIITLGHFITWLFWRVWGFFISSFLLFIVPKASPIKWLSLTI